MTQHPYETGFAPTEHLAQVRTETEHFVQSLPLGAPLRFGAVLDWLVARLGFVDCWALLRVLDDLEHDGWLEALHWPTDPGQRRHYRRTEPTVV